MIKVENINVWGFEHAIRGMRNPMNSWDKSDSTVLFHMVQNFSDDDPRAQMYNDMLDNYGINIQIGPADMNLMRKLYAAGPEHRKYLRQIFVSMDITAPLYWWKEFDTYKVGTVSNSCSTMHKIHAKEFTLDDFSHEHLLNFQDKDFAAVTVDGNVCLYSSIGLLEMICDLLNHYRKAYLDTKDKIYWWQMIQMLPSSYNQRRTITMNYENVMTMIHQRTGHKLDEWNEFVDILKEFPYVKEIRGENEETGSL